MAVSRVTAYMTVAVVLLLGLCDGTRPAGSQQMLDGAEEMGLIGSMRHQANEAHLQRVPLFRGQISPDENQPLVVMHLPARIKREALAGETIESGIAQLGDKASKAVQQPKGNSELAAQVVPKKPKREAPQAGEAKAPLATLGEQLQKQGSAAMTQIQGQASQLAAQLPGRRKRQAATPLAPVMNYNPPKLASGQASGEVNSPLAAFGEQLRVQGAAATQQLQNLGNQFAASLQPLVPKRARRQVQYPSLASSEQTSLQSVEKSSQPAGSGIMKYLSDLGQQAQQAQAIQQLFQAAGASGSQKPPSNPLASLGQTLSATSGSSSAPGGGFNVAQLMSQLTELIRSTQDNNARVVESTQRSLESANQQTMEAAKSAQGGIQSALAEMGQGLQRLASNNPNLLPDIKNLYQSVSSKLSSASSSVAQTASSNQPGLPSLPVAQS